MRTAVGVDVAAGPGDGVALGVASDPPQAASIEKITAKARRHQPDRLDMTPDDTKAKWTASNAGRAPVYPAISAFSRSTVKSGERQRSMMVPVSLFTFLGFLRLLSRCLFAGFSLAALLPLLGPANGSREVGRPVALVRY